MKIKNFVKISAFAILVFSMLGCGKEEEKAEAEHMTREKIVIDLIESMVKIPDSAEHKGLYFGKYEVTQEQWQEIMGNNPSYFKGDSSLPVEKVSWNECQEFIEKLNACAEVKQAGITFRLPTEEECEYACRAGSTGKYGMLADGREGTLDEMGWYDDNSDYKTHPVGQKKPNAWGLYDMHGNVLEWTASADGSYRIVRGGGYYFDASDCESDDWHWYDPDYRLDYLGFRLVALNKVEAERIAREEAERKAREKAESLIKDMVRIPDSAEHKGLYFAKYEVTQEQWQEIMGNNPSCFTGDLSRPVEYVSWNDCQEFIKKLNARAEVKQAGITFRLPTEEEWEYACRAGSTGKYGLLADGREGSLDEMGWYCDNSGNKTHPVGQKKPNAWGLYDMHGNVWEWTASANGSSRIRRGGCYYFNASNCESDNGLWNDPDCRYGSLGFRLVASRKIETKTSVTEIIETMVQIPGEDYLMGKYEVTQAQWQLIMGENPSNFTGDLSRPVEQVSWDDCQEFIEKLNARTEVKSAGITFRLPTKEEWEYACRAGSTGKYGLLADGREGTLDEMGWYEDNSDDKTHPVGQKKPNAWGLYDMHGNVWEWTASADGSYRFRRGGSCYNRASSCESGSGGWGNPGLRYGSLGFRLVASRTGIETKTSVKEIIETMVKIPGKDYLMGKYEVTQAQWEAIMGNNPSSYITGDSSLPVEKVSWNECQEFIEKLNACAEVKQAGITFRLPTEEEWEYACRAGSTGKYGLLADGREGTLDEMGWYDDNSDYKTHPVGQKKPNAWGLYDMHGNVLEWTASADGSSRIFRGGGFYISASGCESDDRLWSDPDGRYGSLGFRLVASRTEK